MSFNSIAVIDAFGFGGLASLKSLSDYRDIDFVLWFLKFGDRRDLSSNNITVVDPTALSGLGNLSNMFVG